MYSPTLDEFLKLADQGNLIPVTRRLLADVETPLSAYRKIRGPGESFLFESVEGGEHLGRYSFVGCNPRAIIRQVGQTVEVIENGKVSETLSIQAEAGQGSPAPGAGLRDGLEAVERVMKKYRAVPVPGLPRFTGGAVGFIGYEFIHDVEPVVPRPPHDDLQTPVIYFLIADQLLIFDRVAQTITVLVNAVLEDAASPAEAYENATGEIDRLVSLLEQPIEHHPVTVPGEVPPLPFESNLPQEKFYRQRPQGQAIHHLGRHHPGGRLPALLVPRQSFAARHLPRRPLDQPVALHVPARAGRVRTGRRLTRNPRPLRGPQG